MKYKSQFTTEKRRELLMQLLEVPELKSTNGKRDFAAAFAARPDLAESLGYGTKQWGANFTMLRSITGSIKPRPRQTAHASKKRAKPSRPAATEIKVNFCPNCGCNLHAVAVGMAAAIIP